LVESYDENADLKHRFRLLQLQIQQLKEEITEKEKMLSKVKMDLNSKEKDLSKVDKDKKDVQAKLAQNEDKIVELQT
jgi:septal ring factor EnvC (AmiA/AmiB activator)